VTAGATRLLALDWGTTSLRAHRLGDGGAVLETRLLPRGIMHLARPTPGHTEPAKPSSGLDEAFEDAFEEACGDWRKAAPGAPVIACGMVGSAQGWRQAAYLDVPASFEHLAAQLTRVDASNGAVVHIVPGLIERGRLPNVMRGEETQILGALDAAARAFPRDSKTLVGLPGTHSKWAVVRGRQVVHFDTFMTGEVYAALCSHTLLGRTLRRTAEWDREAFDRGAAVARSPEGHAGVLSTIFSTRTLGLTGVLSPEAQADYLSGLLIGHELQALEALDRHAFDGAGGIVLVGAEALSERYRRVLASLASGARVSIARQATERGCWRLACDAGLIDARQANPAEQPLRQALSLCGLLAILRGVRPAEAREIGGALYAAGWRALEVPLNSPDPLASLRLLREALPADCAIGAGTVLTPAQVEEVREAGGQFIVMPHADASVIRAGKAAGLEVAAGAATITEAFAALGAGADIIKMFPADQLGPGTLAAWRAVLPAEARVIPVGGIGPSQLAPFIAAGAAGFGIGSALYRPGRSGSELAEPAAALMAAWRAAASRAPARSGE
jgi:2-dehydro-3-deoxygalactonokinase